MMARIVGSVSLVSSQISKFFPRSSIIDLNSFTTFSNVINLLK